MSVEAGPALHHSVHRYFLVHNGITHVENLFLEDLAKQHIYEFLLIITPLRLACATDYWVHPNPTSSQRIFTNPPKKLPYPNFSLHPPCPSHPHPSPPTQQPNKLT